jgi:hypothetical protein
VPNDVETAIRKLCLAFPETEESRSHGMPHFSVIRPKRTFATYAQNHHADGRIAVWLNVPDGMQDAYVQAEPKHYFVPPYVGPSGWLGVRLDRGIACKRVAQIVRAAFENSAPSRVFALLTKTHDVPEPKTRITAADIDPKNSALGKGVLAAMRKVCLNLPETSESAQFGQPVWKVGRRVFAQAYCYESLWRVAFWVGVGAQGLMTTDARFEIPPYIGHNGWIALDVTKRLNESELRSLAIESYRHFALKRMLAKLLLLPGDRFDATDADNIGVRAIGREHDDAVRLFQGPQNHVHRRVSVHAGDAYVIQRRIADFDALWEIPVDLLQHFLDGGIVEDQQPVLPRKQIIHLRARKLSFDQRRVPAMIHDSRLFTGCQNSRPPVQATLVSTHCLLARDQLTGFPHLTAPADLHLSVFHRQCRNRGRHQHVELGSKIGKQMAARTHP